MAFPFAVFEGCGDFAIWFTNDAHDESVCSLESFRDTEAL